MFYPWKHFMFIPAHSLSSLKNDSSNSFQRRRSMAHSTLERSEEESFSAVCRGSSGPGVFEKPVSVSQNHVERIFWQAHVPPTGTEPAHMSCILASNEHQPDVTNLSNVWLESGGKTFEYSRTPIKAMHDIDFYSSMIKDTKTCVHNWLIQPDYTAGAIGFIE